MNVTRPKIVWGVGVLQMSLSCYLGLSRYALTAITNVLEREAGGQLQHQKKRQCDPGSKHSRMTAASQKLEKQGTDFHLEPVQGVC